MSASQPPFVVDVEASGFGAGSYPIEVGLALRPGRRHSFLIRPEPDWTHWSEGAEAVHGITREVLARHGRAAAQVADELNALLAGARVYSDAWVVDKPWLGRLFHAARRPMAFDVSPIEALLSEARLVLWDGVKREVADELAVTRHRASHDAWVVQETLSRTRRLAA